MEPETPIERIKKAIDGRPPHAYAQVRPSDVLAVAATVPLGKSTPAIEAVTFGAKNARPDLPEVHQVAGHLKELVDAAQAPPAAPAG